MKGQWGAPYTNHWVVPATPYLKITVNQNGIQKLPANLLPEPYRSVDPSRLQLWHRGRQIAISIAENKDILFYAVVNDGSSDALLYRPYTGKQDNPYSSFFSDKSAYFLTSGPANSGLRMKEVPIPAQTDILPEKYHLQNDVTLFTDDYSQSIDINFYLPSLMQSYLENGKGLTGKIYGKHKNLTHAALLGDFKQSILFKDLYTEDPSLPASVEALIFGRAPEQNKISILFGKSEATLRTVYPSITFDGFTSSRSRFNVNYASSSSSDLSNSGEALLSIISNNITDSYRTTTMFSPTYIKSEYPQKTTMSGQSSKIFTFTQKVSSYSKARIIGTPNNAAAYDITDPSATKILSNITNIADGLELFYENRPDSPSKIYISNQVNLIGSAQLQHVTLQSISPDQYDYLIITNSLLFTSASKYANYRNSEKGGNFRTLVIDVQEIYDQFNYGEPSPVAIRRFVDFMLSKGVRQKHNLLLVGPAIAWGDKFKSNKDLPGQVPSIGPPGSDLLLVEGLAGAPEDVPAIPVGRIPAVTSDQVDNYLEKVKVYESSSVDIAWKKRVLHLSGGKTSAEITQLRNALGVLSPFVQNGEVGGSVKPFVKQSIVEVEPVDITRDVNEGVGMISYFGHGSPSVTDLDMGYASDLKKGYQNAGKYPLMYFNGCGVGNIFKGNWNSDLAASDHVPLSFDWLLARDKGAIAIIANSYYSFLSPSSRYVNELYQKLFMETSAAEFSIGKIQQEVARKIKNSGNYGEMDRANLHQSVLQGDPALHLIRTQYPDYLVDPDEAITLHAASSEKTLETSDKIKLAIAMANQGKNSKEGTIDLRIRFFYQSGKVISQTASIPLFPNVDTLYIDLRPEGTLQKIEVAIDPSAKIQELSKANNVAELLVDWEVAKKLKLYPSERIRDLVAPLLDVTFNNRIIPNNAVISPNPTIRFTLTDDRLILGDTSLLDIRIKPCGDNSCNYTRLNFSDPNIILVPSDGNQLVIKYSPQNWTSGTYEMLITSRDKSGNTISQPYRTTISISEGQHKVSVIASPNPATSNHVLFEIKGINPSHLVSGTFKIYNTRGIIETSKTLSAGETNWYWIPASPAGVYLYKVEINAKDTDIQHLNGKVIIGK